MATLLKVLNNLADIKSAGGVALRVRTQGGKRCSDRAFLDHVRAGKFRFLIWDRHVNMFDHKLEPKPSVARRVEVFTGTGRRRRWSSDEKAWILEETLAVGAVVSEVARRHGITSQQLFGWRRSARGRAMERSETRPSLRR